MLLVKFISDKKIGRKEIVWVKRKYKFLYKVAGNIVQRIRKL